VLIKTAAAQVFDFVIAEMQPCLQTFKGITQTFIFLTQEVVIMDQTKHSNMEGLH
jgi:hypothetical protein